MQKLFYALLLLFLSFQLKSQYLAAFLDYQDHFWIFEAGEFHELEYLEIQDFQVGGNLVAYKDNGSKLKVYQHGNIETLLTGDPVEFKATDYLLGYSMYEELHVYDNGDAQLLSTESGGYVVQDSLIGWYNKISQTIQIYYNGKIYTVEDGLIYNPLKEFKTGDNTVAYIQSSTKQFKLFYQGEIIILDDFAENLTYETGRDIVAFYDSPDQSFKVFYKGEITELEPFQPKSFKVGDDIMVYIDNLGKLKYFSKGESITLTNYEPEFYDVVDNVFVYEEQGYFKTYCNGEVKTIERYVPNPYMLDYHTIAYLDENRFVKAYQNCEPETISYDKVGELEVIRDLIIFVQGINKTMIYFNGKLYEH